MAEKLDEVMAVDDQAAIRREVLARLAHDLRNPLNLISTALALLDSGLPAQELPRVLGWVRSGADQMTALLRDQLELARLDDRSVELERQPVAVAALLDEAARGIAGAGEVRVDADADGLEVPADRPALVAAIARLAEHLIDGATEAVVTLSGSRESDGARIAVTVAGGRAARGDRAVERRQRVPKPAELPVALAAAAVERHGGELRARDTRDGSAQVDFRLPLSPGT